MTEMVLYCALIRNLDTGEVFDFHMSYPSDFDLRMLASQIADDCTKAEGLEGSPWCYRACDVEQITFNKVFAN